MPQAESRLVVGKLVGAFGVKGWIKVKSHTEPITNILGYQPWWLQTKQGLRRVEVDAHAVHPQGLVVHIKGVEDRDEALALSHALVEVDSTLLPDLDEGNFYWHQLVGLHVKSLFDVPEPKLTDSSKSQAKLLGSVSGLMETGANDVLVIQPCEGSFDKRERLVPYLPGDAVIKVDLAAGCIWVDWDPDF
jgi:16S rRNA processing protein RimM